MTRALDHAVLLATETDIDPMTGHGPEWGKAAPVALLIIVLLGIALYFLIKSMNKQMKKVPASFETDSDPDRSAEQSVEAEPADPDRGPDSDEEHHAAGEPTRGQHSTARSERGFHHRSN